MPSDDAWPPITTESQLLRWSLTYHAKEYGPFFFDSTVNKGRHLQMLQELWSVVEEEGRANEILLMQDGAPLWLASD
ncbi:hypothetical protein FJT64_017816 [Amphibalanus amphitrite]|uniref:Uncharacterized protein n=1 Tax=Amphibalanus amphitrite TaxID=1232801 RepID=A0A6A4XAJ8_AMPAM|nr:hypothetical protein FJT64_017816 [Amphibalanus amphitrite]